MEKIIKNMLFTIFFTALKNKEEEVDPFYRRLWEENINPRKKKIKKKSQVSRALYFPLR